MTQTFFIKAAQEFKLEEFLRPPRADSVDISAAGSLPTGTHVVVPSQVFQGEEEDDVVWHHGLFVGKHFNAKGGNPRFGMVLHMSKESGPELVPVSDFRAPDDNIYFVIYPEEGCFPVETTLHLADLLLKCKEELPHELFENNCETIVCLCKVGKCYQPVFDACNLIPRPIPIKRRPKLLL
jgi:hypothetical protein